MKKGWPRSQVAELDAGKDVVSLPLMKKGRPARAGMTKHEVRMTNDSETCTANCHLQTGHLSPAMPLMKKGLRLPPLGELGGGGE
jgi:hypothetical protein